MWSHLTLALFRLVSAQPDFFKNFRSTHSLNRIFFLLLFNNKTKQNQYLISHCCRRRCCCSLSEDSTQDYWIEILQEKKIKWWWHREHNRLIVCLKNGHLSIYFLLFYSLLSVSPKNARWNLEFNVITSECHDRERERGEGKRARGKTPIVLSVDRSFFVE